MTRHTTLRQSLLIFSATMHNMRTGDFELHLNS